MPTFQGEDKLIKFLNGIDDEAAEAKGDLERRMGENLDLIRGKQWKGSSPPYFLYNIIEATTEEKVGKLSESRPKITVQPTRNNLDEAAEALRKTIAGLWDRHNIEYRTERIGFFGAVAGASFVGTPYNPNLNHGEGDIDFVVKDPRACGVDLAVMEASKADTGEYLTLEDFVPLDMLKFQYPARAAELKPSERVSGFVMDASKPKTTRALLRQAYSRIFKGNEAEKRSVIPKAVLREYYIQDRRRHIEDIGVVPIIDGVTKWAPPKSVPFPGGRRILRAGNIILEDSFNPYWDGLYPVDMMSWKTDLESVWGPDEVQPIKRMQEAINRLGDGYTKTALINAVVRVVMDYGALSPEERNKLSNQVGEIIEKAPGRTFEYQVPPLLSVDVINFINQLMAWVREKVGTIKNPAQKDLPSIVTGPAIEGIQLMIETPIRTAARRIEEFYGRIGQKFISRIFQYYTSNRLIQLIGPDNEWMSFELERRKLLLDSKGQPRSEGDIRKAWRDFYFAVEPMSSLAITRVQRAMMKFQLAEQGWLHPKEVLEEAGFRNPEEKLRQAQEALDSGLIRPKDQRSNNGKQNSAMPDQTSFTQ